MREKIGVSNEILQSLMTLRAYGRCRLSDVPAVLTFLRELGDSEAANWVSANRAEYLRGLIVGFQPKTKSTGS